MLTKIAAKEVLKLEVHNWADDLIDEVVGEMAAEVAAKLATPKEKAKGTRLMWCE